MPDLDTWRWGVAKEVVVDLSQALGEYPEAHEPVASPDGERVAHPVQKDDDTFGVLVNGELWEGAFEKAWHLRFSPDGRLTALVRVDDEWTVAVEGELWEERYTYAWNTLFSPRGGTIGVQVKQDVDYSVSLNGKAWDQGFKAMRGFALSDDGLRAAATVQVEEVPEADIFKFAEGTWSVAVDGEAWDSKFINVWAPTFSPDGAHVAAQARLDICDYTMAEDGKAWEKVFGGIWEPLYRGGSIVVPVRQKGGWTLAEGGKLLWQRSYVQLWHQRLCPKGRRLAAVVAPSFGRWTVAVDDQPWSATFSDVVQPPIFSPDGARVAATVRDEGRWGVAVDGKLWPEPFDMAWDPVFSPDGKSVAAKVDCDGRYTIALDGKVWDARFEALWDPVFSPEGDKLLIRAIEGGKYIRQVVPVDQARGRRVISASTSSASEGRRNAAMG